MQPENNVNAGQTPQSGANQTRQNNVNTTQVPQNNVGAKMDAALKSAATPVQENVMTQGVPGGKPAGEKNKMSKKQIVGLVVLSLIAIGGVLFGVYGMNSQNDQIAQLTIRATDAEGKVAQLETEKITITDPDGGTTEITEMNNIGLGDLNGIHFFDDTISEGQRYNLMVINKNDDNYMTKTSEDDEFYTLDISKIGSGNVLKKIDLVSILKPETDNIISNNLPENSTNALGQVTNKSQCEQFTVSYYDPRADLIGSDVEEWDKSTELPIRTSFFCHQKNNTEQVKFYDMIYILDVDSETVRQHRFGGKNNFQQ